MNIEKMRREFEAAMPLPEGTYWADGNYMTSSNHFSCLEYRGAWKGYQAARLLMLSGVEIDGIDLIGQVVRNVKGPSKYRSKYGTARWVLVRDAFGIGSGVANVLCRKFGFDPDEDLRS